MSTLVLSEIVLKSQQNIASVEVDLALASINSNLFTT